MDFFKNFLCNKLKERKFMIHEKINFKNLSYDELIKLIVASQKELEERGTITQCKNIFYKEGKGIKCEFITGYAKKII